MKKKLWISSVLCLTLAVAIVSCQQEEEQASTPETPSAYTSQEDLRVAFTKTLAKAVENPAVRSLLHDEAARKFDNDADVLFALVKDEKVAGETSLFDYMAGLHGSREAFTKLVDDMPLLTILVPELISFNIDTWDADSQVPWIATTTGPEAGNGVTAFRYTGEEVLLDKTKRPEFPVLVVKYNERVSLSPQTLSDDNGRKGSTAAFHETPATKYYFKDAAYDNVTPKDDEAGRTIPIVQINNWLDPMAYNAFVNGATYHRDYVYYGITPPPTTGAFRPNYSEYITSFRIESLSSANYIFDDQFSDWTDGNLEFFFNVYFVDDKTGLKSVLKIMSCSVTDLFVFTGPNTVSGVKEYTLPTPIEISSWDMKRYGDTWKFVLIEDDNTGISVTYTTQVGSNFGSNFTNNVKDGPGFGSTSSTSYSQSVAFQINSQSDQLGEALLSYFSPIITGTTIVMYNGTAMPGYTTYEISTGIVRFAVEPRKAF